MLALKCLQISERRSESLKTATKWNKEENEEKKWSEVKWDNKRKRSEIWTFIVRGLRYMAVKGSEIHQLYKEGSLYILYRAQIQLIDKQLTCVSNVLVTVTPTIVVHISIDRDQGWIEMALVNFTRCLDSLQGSEEKEMKRGEVRKRKWSEKKKMKRIYCMHTKWAVIVVSGPNLGVIRGGQYRPASRKARIEASSSFILGLHVLHEVKRSVEQKWGEQLNRSKVIIYLGSLLSIGDTDRFSNNWTGVSVKLCSTWAITNIPHIMNTST